MPGNPPRWALVHRGWHWAAYHLGRRGSFLALLGLMWFLTGLALIGAPPNENTGAQTLLHERLPTALRVALWCTTGGIALFYAFRRTPPGDNPGFIAAVAMPAERAASFLWGFLVWLWPWTSAPGYPRGLLQSLQWLAVIAAIQIIAGWRETPRENPL